MIRYLAIVVTILQFATGATAQTSGLQRSALTIKPEGIHVIESAARATLEDNAIRVTLPLSVPAGPASRVTLWLASPRDVRTDETTVELKPGAREATIMLP